LKSEIWVHIDFLENIFLIYKNKFLEIY